MKLYVFILGAGERLVCLGVLGGFKKIVLLIIYHIFNGRFCAIRWFVKQNRETFINQWVLLK